MSVICNKQFAPLKSSSLLTVHIVRGPGTYRWFGSPMANRNDSNGKSAMCVSPLIPQTLLSQRVNRSSQQAHQSKENAFIHRWGIASIRCGNGLEKTPSVPFRLVSLSLYWRFIFATNFQRQKEVAIWKWKTYNTKTRGQWPYRLASDNLMKRRRLNVIHWPVWARHSNKWPWNDL